MESAVTNKIMCSFSGARSFLSVLLLSLSLSTIHNSAVSAWMPPASLTSRPSSSWRTTSFVLSAEETESETTDNKNDKISQLEQDLKIAKLEAELRALKGEDDTASDGEASPAAAVVDSKSPKSKSKPIVVIDRDEEKAPKKKADEEDEEMLEEASMDMFLSEGWKEARTGYDPKNTATLTRKTEEQSSMLGLVAKIGGAILALVVFSQIPVGQEDLSKYSSIKSSAPKVTIDLGDTNRVKGQILNADY